MEIVKSKIDGQPLAIVFRKTFVQGEREDLDDPSQLLQVSAKRLPPGKDFRAHRHLPLARTTVGTQEVWFVVDGLVRVTLYDIDGTQVLATTVAGGDAFVTFRGSHALHVITPTLIYEVKNGPYLGQAADKIWLDADDAPEDGAPL